MIYHLTPPVKTNTSATSAEQVHWYIQRLRKTDGTQTISLSVQQYTSTVNALLLVDISPAKPSTPTAELQAKLGGKAGSWLAKGQQAVKSLEKKKIDGFVLAPTVSW